MKSRRFVIKAIEAQRGVVLVEAETGDEYLCKGKALPVGSISPNGKLKKTHMKPAKWGPNPDYKPERKKKKVENQTKDTSKQKDKPKEKEKDMNYQISISKPNHTPKIDGEVVDSFDGYTIVKVAAKKVWDGRGQTSTLPTSYHLLKGNMHVAKVSPGRSYRDAIKDLKAYGQKQAAMKVSMAELEMAALALFPGSYTQNRSLEGITIVDEKGEKLAFIDAQDGTTYLSKKKEEKPKEKEAPMSRTRSEMKEMADALGLDFLEEGDFMVAADPSTQMNQKLEDYSRMVEDDVPEKELKAEEQKIRAFYREHWSSLDGKAMTNFKWMFPGKPMRTYGEGTYRLEQKILAEADRDHD